MTDSASIPPIILALLTSMCGGHGDDDTAVDTGDDDAIVVTADDPQGWENSRDTEGDGGPCAGEARAGDGSLCLHIDAPSDGVSPAYTWSIAQDFGLVADFEAASFDFWRSSETTAYGHFTPAIQLEVTEADGGVTWLIWEGTYNGFASYSDSVPEDEWVSDDIGGDYWWQWDDGVVEIFNRTVHDWGYSDDARVTGIGVALGSGWNGSFTGYADLLSVTFAGETTTWNFEP